MERFSFHIDWIDTVILLLLSCFGLFLILTISSSLFAQQAIYVLLGIGLLVLASFLDAAMLLWIAPFGYVMSLLFLVVPFLAAPVRGAYRWIQLWGTQLQPSELTKPLLLLAFSWVMTRYPPRNLRYALLHFLLFLLPFALVFKQPDLGTSIVYAVFWVTMMVAGGFPLPHLAGVATLLGFVFPGFWHILAPYQQQRILTFLRPTIDPKGAGYNAIQAMIAVGSGQWFGRGLGRGTQSHLRFLPEYHTDFIFATLVEELGFVGGAALLVLYGVLLWRVIAPLLRADVENATVFLYSVGLFGMILAQVVINTGMNMGLIPITGITLPLISYGGSSILSLMIAFGILWSLRRLGSGKHIAMATSG